ncbi:MAG: homocysteine S-methyltransferase family protein [bacterium]|nr:homocysteine S-methyltransferase family protein [bacterium]MDY4098646.1 homocysteine S-methyltransferase family protein [Lachnospiraceae bacterium]
MTRKEFREMIESRVIVLDGATGTNLQKAGMPTGVCPEKWILEHPQALIDLQKAYVAAGTDIVYAPTFTASRIKLEEYGLSDRLEEMNRALVALSKEAVAGSSALVAGDLTMTGKQLAPIGDLPFETLVDVYKEQARVLADAGVDLFVVETMMSLQETRAALIAIREVCDLPVMASLTYESDGRTLYGTDAKTAMVVLQSLGADVVGLNCSTGPMEMVAAVEQMREAATIPILAKPNAGLPQLEDGVTVYRMTPEEFASAGAALVRAGASVVGGCCGTTPAHIGALADVVKALEAPAVSSEKKRLLATERSVLEIDLDGSFLVVGERINPTGKKALQAELREGSLDLVCRMAEEQEENGAAILDVNMGMNGIDEKEMMLAAIEELTTASSLPLCLDSSNVDVLEAALRIYPGRALINSVSLESEKIDRLLPIVAKYGAMFILLPLSDEGIPATVEEKRGIVRTILERAYALGFTKEDIVVDGLTATVGANPDAALECFDTIRYCRKELGLATICGLSNISFGLPNRPFVNTAFLTMAIQNGLTMAIANPSQDLLMNAAFASDMLLHKPDSDIRYINRMQVYEKHLAEKEAVSQPVKKKAFVQENVSENEADAIFSCVLKGDKKHIVEKVKEALAAGEQPGDIISEKLIPAINDVGDKFEKQIYFLPQLIASASAMQTAIEHLEPLLARGEGEGETATIVIATVEGDIHDIGKNLVVLMLKNYGYNVIDLGKDVAAETIIAVAMEQNAQIIGLSALMTTTMMRMKDVVELAKEKGCTSKIIIGGACITESFAQEIGADGYSADAASCVKLVQKLLA